MTITDLQAAVFRAQAKADRYPPHSRSHKAIAARGALYAARHALMRAELGRGGNG